MILSPADWSAVRVSVLVSLAAVAVSLPVGVALGWALARGRFRGKTLLEALVFLPLVLPPVVTGYLLLLLLGRRGWIGRLLFEHWGVEIAFTWKGMAVAAGVVGLPLLVHSCRLSLEAVDRRLEEAARTLGYSALATFGRVTLPLAWPGVAAGALLTFARALGEFGATVMLAPNVDGTRTIALEVFHRFSIPGTEQWDIARLAVVSAVLSFVSLVVTDLLARRLRGRRP